MLKFFHKYPEAIQLNTTHIFDNINNEELERMIVCFEASIKNFPTQAKLSVQPENENRIGIMLEGEADLIKYDYDGCRNIIEHLEEQDIFGNIFLQPFDDNDMEVISCTKCKVLYFDYKHLIKRCENACTYHSSLVNNVLQIFSVKTRQLHSRIEILSQRSIRNKLLIYFQHLAYTCHSNSFRLPFTLNSMADYLFVDRSAMLREMKKMREEVWIESKGRSITLLL